MKMHISTFLTTGLLLALTACGGGEGAVPSDEDTSGTARGLLSSVPEKGQRSVPEQPGVSAPTQDFDVDELGFDFGDPNAPVRVVELSDYGCGYCRQFHQQTWPTIKERFVDTGMVQWKFMPFITGMFTHSLAATQASECSMVQGDEAFLAVNERLWDDQSAWKGASDAESTLRTMVDGTGTSMDEWETCMDANARVDRVRAATGIARDLGVRGTPTFFIRGYPPLQGALPVETFTQILQMVYAEATSEAGPEGQGGP